MAHQATVSGESATGRRATSPRRTMPSDQTRRHPAATRHQRRMRTNRRATRRMAEMAHHLGSTTKTDRRRQTRPAETTAARPVIKGVMPRRRIAAQTAKPTTIRAVEAKRNLRGNEVDGPTETASDAMQLATLGKAAEMSAARIASPPIKRNPIAEAMMATVGVIESLEVQRLSQRSGE
jgi:hypothetical protein